MNTFPRFDDIAHPPLRAYNRTVMAYNIRDDHGQGVMVEYLEGFSPEQRVEMAHILALVQKVGVKRTKELVTDGMVFSDDQPAVA